ncbi:MAG: 30S ribosome-binding factor RbfA [Planctomycetes bacterium]|nr:30S ribosome-binding factor RbfA [Planctomycetota bacterium]
MNERRLARLQEQIKQRLAEVLQRELADPKLGLVTITRVELDDEFTQCKAYWSVIAPTGQEARARKDSQNVLQRARGFCQREMGKVLHTRTVPHLEFRFDEGIGGAIRIQQLLHDLKEEAGARPAEDTPASDVGPADAPADDTPRDS